MPSQEERFQRKLFHGCIYCGDTEYLSAEHIIPYALGGTSVIPKGSCRNCADITKKFEQTIARSMLGNFRIKNNAPTRRPKERPSTLLLKIIQKDTDVSRKLDPSEHPGCFVLPVFSPPRVMSNLLGVTQNLHQEMKIWGFPDPAHIQKFLPSDLPEGSKTQIGTFSIDALVRSLAKIAHCHCASMYGAGVFNPFLSPLILGKTREYANYIGGSKRSNAELPGLVKGAPIAVQSTVGNYYGTWFLITTIHLFPGLNGPVYDVIVGSCTDQSAAIGPKMPGSGL